MTDDKVNLRFCNDCEERRTLKTPLSEWRQCLCTVIWANIIYSRHCLRLWLIYLITCEWSFSRWLVCAAFAWYKMSSSKLVSFELMQKIIESAKGAAGKITIKSLHIENGAAIGENFCSSIERVQATVCTLDDHNQPDENWHFIVKSSLFDGEYEILNQESNYFPKEIHVFRDIIPAVEKLLRSIDDQTVLSPK